MKKTKRFLVYYNAFEGTKKNLSLVKSMFNHLRRYFPKKKQVFVLNEGFHYTGDLFEDMMMQIEHCHYEWGDVRKRVWKSFGAQLDSVNAVFAQMED